MAVHSSTRMQRHFNAPRAKVFRAILDAQAVEKWLVPDGMSGQVHQFDAREGGAIRVSLTYLEPTGAGKTSAHTDTYHGRFVKLVPDWQVVQVLQFETSDPTLAGEMKVTYTLTDAGTGTDVLAVHEDLPSGLAEADNETGWRVAFDKLAAYVESGETSRTSA